MALAALLLAGLGSPPAGSRELYRNEAQDLSVRLDTTVSLGVSLRTQDQDRGLIWIGHGGTNSNAASINNDDGNLNYDRGDVYSVLTKATSELEARWRNYHLFVRGTAFWDPVANCEGNGGRGAPGSSGFERPDCTRRSPLDQAARHRASRYEGGVVGAQLQLLDAYVQGSWQPLERPIDVRVGNQLISWGEGFFYQGINQVNPVDVTRLRVPGSEIKEALLPSPMVRVQAELFPNLGLDAYYQFYWNPTYLDPTGSYFSSSDLIGRGASLPASGDGETQALFLPDLLNRLAPADPGGTGLAPETLIGQCLAGAFLCRGAPRVGTDEPPSQGQGGVALRYFLEQAQTELGLYYVHYHSKTPVLAFHGYGVPDLNQPGTPNNLPFDYFRQYPDDIDLVGASFATQLFGSAVAGEISYRPNDPVPLNALVGGLLPVFGPTRVDGFEREHRLQFILNVLASFAPGTRWIGPLVGWIGASDVSFIAEWGLVYYPGLDAVCEGTGQIDPTTGSPVGSSPIQTGCTAYAGPAGTLKGVDDLSWGYQLRVGPNWYNPFGIPVRFQPFVGWQHDVDGTTPGLSPHVDRRKALSVGFDVIYLDRWTGRVSYANFFGGGNANLTHDRDFVSFSLSYAF